MSDIPLIFHVTLCWKKKEKEKKEEEDAKKKKGKEEKNVNEGEEMKKD